MTISTNKDRKIRTTLYLTLENKKRLERIPRGKRTLVINQAIAHTLKQMDRQETKKSLLKALNNIQPIQSHEPVEKTIRNARQERLVQLSNDVAD